MSDYKQLKALILDGVTMGLQEGLGVRTGTNGNITSLPSNTETTLVTATISKGGVYYIRGTASYQAATTTGATIHVTRIKVNGTTLSEEYSNNADQNVFAETTSIVREFQENDVITLTVQSNRTISGVSGNIQYTSLLHIPIV